MVKHFGILLLSVTACFGSVALAVGNPFVPERFANAVWSYAEDLCPAEAFADDELNRDMYGALSAPIATDQLAIGRLYEAVTMDVGAHLLSDIGRRGAAMSFLGSEAVQEGVTFMAMVQDDTHLASEDFLDVENKQHGRTAASVEIAKCLFPTSDQIIAAQDGLSAADEQTQLWLDAALPLYTNHCEIDYVVLVERYLAFDFASVAPSERADAVAALNAEHEAYLEANPASERCEDFS